MKESIRTRIFLAATALFFFVILFHALVFSQLFDSIYLNSMLATYQKEFFQATCAFSNGDVDSAHASLREYTAKTGSPVLTFDQNYQFCDKDFFRYLGIATVRDSEGTIYHFPINYLYSLIDFPILSISQQVSIRAIPLGESSYYEPILLATGDRAYTNGSSAIKYQGRQSDTDSLDIRYIEGQVESVHYVQSDENSFANYAVMLYDQMKDCLVLREDIGEYLSEISGKSVFDEYGNEYRIFTERVTDGDTTRYFVSIRHLFFTGQEKEYLSTLFVGIYAVLGVLLLLSAAMLSHYISRHLSYLSHITQKIGSLDFSETAKIPVNNEFGKLAENITSMSKDLGHALENSTKNELQMKSTLADIAHEFKTPLGLIQMYTDMFESGVFDDPAVYYSKMEAEISGLTQMVNDIIELSKLQSGSRKMEIGVWHLGDIISSVLESYQAQLVQGSYTLETDIPEIDVKADARRIGQVLSNLLSNALKYTDEKRHIKIFVRSETPGFVEVAICNGGYLSELDQKRIWERYYSTNSTGIARLPSDGMGLDIVRNILTAHNSQYGVRMEGDDVCFYFTLEKAEP